jgi:hypothetical protein
MGGSLRAQKPILSYYYKQETPTEVTPNLPQADLVG